MEGPYGSAPEWEEVAAGPQYHSMGPSNAAIPHLSLPAPGQLEEHDDTEARLCALMTRMSSTKGDATPEETSGSISVLRSYEAFTEDAAVTFLDGGPVSSLLESEIMSIEPVRMGWAGSISSMVGAVKLIIQILLYEASLEVDGGRQLEVCRVAFHSLWKERSTDSHDELFTRCAILNGLRVLGAKAVPSLLCEPTLVRELPNAKAFLYPYLVSKKFRHVMFTLCQEVIHALRGDRDSPQDASMATGIESWDSPKLLEIIQDSWAGWSVRVCTGDLLYFLHAEAVTGVSREDSSVSTLACAVQLPEMLLVEQSLAIDAPEDVFNVLLAWDKVAVLELLMHEFCRVWRRMIQPIGVPLTPRPVGSNDEPNAGDFVDLVIWGAVLSTDLKCRRGGMILNAHRNSENLFTALDINSWDDPNVKLWWFDRPGDRRSDKARKRKSGISADRMVLF